MVPRVAWCLSIVVIGDGYQATMIEPQAMHHGRIFQGVVNKLFLDLSGAMEESIGFGFL
jgi:hypothetical protein